MLKTNSFTQSSRPPNIYLIIHFVISLINWLLLVPVIVIVVELRYWQRYIQVVLVVILQTRRGKVWFLINNCIINDFEEEEFN